MYYSHTLALIKYTLLEAKRFHRMWTKYEIASGNNGQDNKIRAATLLTCTETDALDIINWLPLHETERDNCGRILHW